MDRSIAGLVIAAFFATAGGAEAAGRTPTGAALPEFDRHIAASKAGMMIDPTLAYKEAELAFAVAQRDSSVDGRLKCATAAWLEGEALNRMNASDRAEPVLWAALATVGQVGPDTKLQGDLLLALGWSVATQGRSPAALNDFQQAYKIFQRVGEARSQAKALQNIGSIYEEAGDYQHALKYYADSEEAYRNDPILLLSVRNNKGQVFKEMGRLDQAAVEFKAALGVAHDIHSPLMEVRVLTNLANTEVQAGRLAEAEKTVARAFRLSDHLEAADSWTPFLWGVSAKIAYQRGHVTQAIDDLQRAFAGAESKKATLPFREFHETAYRAYERVGDDRHALEQLEIVRELDNDAQALIASKSASLMAAQFDFSEQNLKISELKAGQLTRDVALAKSRAQLMGGVLAAAGLIVAVLLVSILWIRRSRYQVTQSNRELEAANMRLEQALRAKSEFFSMVSHEIRTPLNGILGMTQVLLGDRNLTADTKEKVEIVHIAGTTMRGLVDDILDAAKMENGGLTIKPVNFDVERALSETTALWIDPAAARGVKVESIVHELPSQIVADKNRFQQILSNLLANAVKFTEVGKIQLTARTEVDSGGEWLVIEVADTGIGIPSDKLDDIFVPFEQVEVSMTRRFGGTGLGLAISRNLARAMGGDILVSSVLAQGSVFTLRTPLVRAEPSPGDTPEVTFAGSLGQARVMVVEPNRLAQGMFKATLGDKVGGLEVYGALDGAEDGLAQQRVDAVVVCLPAGDELDVLRRFVAIAGRAAVVAVLPTGSAVDLGLLTKAGATSALQKPVAPEALFSALTQAIDTAAPQVVAQARAN